MAADGDRTIEVLGILSEGVRFKILSLIASRGEITAKDILAEFDFTQPTLSHHMTCLKDAGLVNAERKGRFTCYSVNKAAIDAVTDCISSLKGTSRKALAGTSQEDEPRELKKGKKKKKKDKSKKKKKD